jgi:hypothetical protein
MVLLINLFFHRIEDDEDIERKLENVEMNPKEKCVIQ